MRRLLQTLKQEMMRVELGLSGQDEKPVDFPGGAG